LDSARKRVRGPDARPAGILGTAQGAISPAWRDGLVGAAALGADNLGTGYGLDRHAATLIGEREAGCIWTRNAGYRVVERYRSSVRLAETRLGIGLRRPFMALARRDRRIDITLSGDCLLRNRSRGALWQGGARMDVAIPAGLELSIAARASEHAEIPGDRRFRGVLSLAYDLDRVVH
jgi:hypothetical protein